MKIYLASDHAGFNLKEKVKEFLEEKDHEVIDCGAFELNKDDDYPDFVVAAAKKVAENSGSRGIVFGKSGAGECIAANKIKGIRAFLAVSEDNVKLARLHNDANVISIGSDFLSFEKAATLITLFLNIPFSNEARHERRIEKISQIENEQ